MTCEIFFTHDPKAAKIQTQKRASYCNLMQHIRMTGAVNISLAKMQAKQVVNQTSISVTMAFLHRTD
jgi:chloramphenicol O-acetyltransferase